MINAFGKKSAKDPFEMFQILRGQSDADDVEFDIHFCGISQFDVQFCNNDLGNTNYPIVPGRELTGVIRFVGNNVQEFKQGDRVGVGTVCDSCMDCEQCNVNREHACMKGFTMTFNEPTKHGHISTDAGYTYGGFSQRITIHQNFVIKIPDKFPLESAAACLTTGTSCYAPLKKFGAKAKPKKVAVVGLGNMGMIGIRIANKLNATVTAMSVHNNKESLAIELGAEDFLSWAKGEDMKKAYRRYDIILNTLAAPHEVLTFLPFLKHDGVIVQLGLLANPHKFVQYPELLRPCLSVAGHISGSVENTRETVNFCAEKGLRPIQTLVLADQLDDIFKIISNPATTVARYTLDVKKSFEKLKDGIVPKEKETDAPDFKDVEGVEEGTGGKEEEKKD